MSRRGTGPFRARAGLRLAMAGAVLLHGGLGWPDGAAAAVYKCVDPATGKVTYGDARCDDAPASKMELPDSAVANGKAPRAGEPQRRIIRPQPEPAVPPADARDGARVASPEERAMGLEWYRVRSRELAAGDFTAAKARRLADAAIISQSPDAVEDALQTLLRHKLRREHAYDDLIACRAKLDTGRPCR